ncbi:MAG TPA: hypothetical protein VD913_03535 [bacterium]|nr:hypothetical protein [bacterium]
MNHIQLKELWRIRFEKILEGEEQASLFYENLLKDNQPFLKGTRLKDDLEQIKKDEIRHAEIARKLIQLVVENE